MSIYKEYILKFEFGWFAGQPFSLLKINIFEKSFDEIYFFSIQIFKLCFNVSIEKR